MDPTIGSWLESQVTIYARDEQPIYLAYGECLIEILGNACRDLAPGATIEARAKTVASFAEKALRKRKKYDDPLHQLTDLCGARVITGTQEELNRICRFIRDNFTVDDANSDNAGARLRASEFGYQSMHFVVQAPASVAGVTVPPAVGSRKAEIQVRTLLQHAWARVAHQGIYKSGFAVPVSIQRDMHRAAALVEEVERDFAAVKDALDRYATGNATRGGGDRRRQEIETLQLVSDCVTDRDERRRLALRLTPLARAAADWPLAVDTLKPFADDGDAAVLRELGVSLCGLHRDDIASPGFREGQQHLVRATEQDPGDAGAHAALARNLEPTDERSARDHYARAYELQPDNPYFLMAYLEFQIAVERQPGGLSLLRPALQAAVHTCRSHVSAGIDAPRALFTEAKLRLLLNEPFAALAVSARAIFAAGALDPPSRAEVLEPEDRAIQRFTPIDAAVSGRPWVERLIRLARAAGLDSAVARDAPLAATSGVEISGPVLIVPGGSENRTLLPRHDEYLRIALDGFRGTVLRGGTQDVVRPEATIQVWTDLLAQGHRPGDVRVLGIGGGELAALDYQIALALGAEVGVVDDSGGAADDLWRDEMWTTASTLRVIPDDRMSVKAFVAAGDKIVADWLDAAARVAHEAFLAENRHKAAVDPAMVPWDDLSEGLKDSNRYQVSYAAEILRAAGFGVRPAGTGESSVTTFDDPALQPEVDLMAEMEHGRWNMERLRAGWRVGPRDPAAKRSPYLVPWSQLPDDIKEWDRKAIRGFPSILARAGLEICRLHE